MSALDYVTYIIKNVSFSTSKISSSYEKSFRAFFLTKMVCLELIYFNNDLDLDNLKKLKNQAEEALKLIKECKLEDDWIKNLLMLILKNLLKPKNCTSKVMHCYACISAS